MKKFTDGLLIGIAFSFILAVAGILAGFFMSGCAGTVQLKNESTGLNAIQGSVLHDIITDNGFDPDSVAMWTRILLLSEIDSGRFTREDVVQYLISAETMVATEFLLYTDFTEEILKYGKLFLSGKNDVSSIAYIMMTVMWPDLGTLKIEGALSPGDQQFVITFIDYLLDGI